ncbi:hypothetical protein [Sorangium sp. So ce388]|uniref:hypothetical protein n=1 Tax=Sorangium sp. So ce388 TaxID=3133309 RepID=UPI003F5AEAC6
MADLLQEDALLRTQPAPPRRPVDTSGMIDPDELDAIAEAVLAEEDKTLSLPVAPDLVLELAYDGCGVFAATSRAGSWWRTVAKYRIKLTFPGRPVTRCVSPADIERYLTERGYEPTLSVERDWPRHIPYAWFPPKWPDTRAPPIHIKPRFVRGTRLCSQPMEEVIEAIAHNEGRSPGEVLREIAVMAQMAEACVLEAGKSRVLGDGQHH